MRKLHGRIFVFLDRDGVINRKSPEGKYVQRWEDFHLLPGVEKAIADLNKAGCRIIVVTNQRGVALGKYSHTDVETIHENLQKHLAKQGSHIDAFYYCPHDSGQCHCRKPAPGLILQAFRDFPDANANNSIMIGDSLSDIEAAHRVNMPAIFIEGPPELQKPGAHQARTEADATFPSLAAAIQSLLDDTP